jgi:hypothetical protein
MNIFGEKLNPQFIEVIEKLLAQHNDFFEIKNNNINYINLYQKNLTIMKYDYIMDYLKEMGTICPSFGHDLSRYNILYYGFLVSQPNNKNQYFHLDYKGKSVTYFIPTVDLTDLNGTEYLYFYNSTNYDKYFELFLDITKKFIDKNLLIQFLETVGLFYKKDYEFRIANCKAYNIIQLPHNVFHRGKINESGKNRIMFQITMEQESIDFIKNEEIIPIAEEDE